MIVQISITDRPNCDLCSESIRQLEDVDDDAESVGARFVKTDDASFVREFGVRRFPTILYFEREAPSIYEGSNIVGLLSSSCGFGPC